MLVETPDEAERWIRDGVEIIAYPVGIKLRKRSGGP